MAITFVNAFTGTTGSTAISGVQAGDLILACVTYDNSIAFNPFAGYSGIGQDYNNVAPYRHSVLFRIADGTETTFTTGGQATRSRAIAIYRPSAGNRILVGSVTNVAITTATTSWTPATLNALRTGSSTVVLSGVAISQTATSALTQRAFVSEATNATRSYIWDTNGGVSSSPTLTVTPAASAKGSAFAVELWEVPTTSPIASVIQSKHAGGVYLTGVAPGDMLVAVASQTGGSIAVPSGWTIRQSRTGTGASIVLATRTATGTEGLNQFQFSGNVSIIAYRKPSGEPFSIGATSGGQNTTTTATIPALTLWTADGSSLVHTTIAGVAGNTALATPPTGLVARGGYNTPVAAYDTGDTGVTSFTAKTKTVTTGGWATSALEIRTVTALNSVDKGPSITLSNNDLTASTTGSGGDIIRGTIGKSAGKWYYEVVPTSLNNDNVFVGIANASAAITSTFMGVDANSAGFATYNSNQAAFYTNGAPDFFSIDSTPGNVFAIAFDVPNGKVWLRTWNGAAWSYWNGSPTADPATNTEGKSFTPGSAKWFPCLSPGTSSESDTINFGSQPMQSSPPSGFSTFDTALVPNSSGVGGSAGFAASIAVGATIRASIGASVGSATASAIASSLPVEAVGIIAGSSVLATTGSKVVSGAASASGIAGVAAAGSTNVSAAGSSPGSSTASAAASAIVATLGISTGASSADAPSRSTFASAGNSFGIGSAVGAGSFTAQSAGTGVSAASSLVQSVGQASAAATGTTSGTSSTNAIGSATKAATGSVAASSAITASGNSLSAASGIVAGLTSVSGTASATAAGAAVSGGSASCSGSSAPIVARTGYVSASSAVIATSSFSAQGAGTGVASASSTAQAVGRAIAAGAGIVSGASTGSASGARTVAGAGSSNGVSASSAPSSATLTKSAAGVASGVATVVAVGVSAQIIVAGAGAAAGFASGAANANAITSGAGAVGGVSSSEGNGFGLTTASGVGNVAGASIIIGLTYDRRSASYGFRYPCPSARRPPNLSTAVRHDDSAYHAPRRKPDFSGGGEGSSSGRAQRRRQPN